MLTPLIKDSSPEQEPVSVFTNNLPGPVMRYAPTWLCCGFRYVSCHVDSFDTFTCFLHRDVVDNTVFQRIGYVKVRLASFFGTMPNNCGSPVVQQQTAYGAAPPQRRNSLGYSALAFSELLYFARESRSFFRSTSFKPLLGTFFYLGASVTSLL